MPRAIWSAVPSDSPALLTSSIVPIFAGRRTSKDFAIGDYQIGKVTNRGSVDFGYPILNRSGEVEGVIYAALDLTWLTHLAAEADCPKGHHYPFWTVRELF